MVWQFPYPGLFALLILGGIGLPFPEDATLILCGFLIARNLIHIFPALLVVYAGLLIADFFLYSVGKKYGRRIVTHKRFHRMISPERLSALEEKFRRKGTYAILLGRHIIGLRAQLFLVSGIMKMHPVKFILADAFSALFTMSFMVGAGYAGAYGLKAVEKDILRIRNFSALGITLIISSYLIYRYFYSRRKKPNKDLA